MKTDSRGQHVEVTDALRVHADRLTTQNRQGYLSQLWRSLGH
jgi:hypothetical protein